MTSLQNSPYFLCHYGVPGRSGKAGAGLWYKNGVLTEEGYRHYYGERMSRASGTAQTVEKPSTVTNVKTNNQKPTKQAKTSEDYKKRKDLYANSVSKMAVRSFIAGAAGTALSKMKNYHARDLGDLLKLVSTAQAVGASISTVGYAYNSARQHLAERKEKKQKT